MLNYIRSLSRFRTRKPKLQVSCCVPCLGLRPVAPGRSYSGPVLEGPQGRPFPAYESPAIGRSLVPYFTRNQQGQALHEVLLLMRLVGMVGSMCVGRGLLALLKMRSVALSNWILSVGF